MNTIRSITLKNILLNKKRSIMTIIGIMLSTALICTVASMFLSFEQSMVELAKNDSGDYHLRIYDVAQEDAKYITQNRDILDYYTYSGIGYAELSNSKNPDKPYLYLMSFDQEALLKSALKLVKGRMPLNNHEIVINKQIIDDAEVVYQLGDKITLDIGKRLSADGELNQNTPYFPDITPEQFVSSFTETYEIVGIISRPAFEIEEYSAPGYTIITTNYPETLNKTYSIHFKNLNKTYKNGWKLIENLDGYAYTFNSELLNWYGVSENVEALHILYGLVAIVIGIIIVSSVFVIRNSFAISTTEHLREYGMLASIGATKKQIRAAVLYEGLILGLVGIPIGIILGVLATFILIIFSNTMLNGIMPADIHFVFRIPIIIIGLSILLSFITIFLSCLTSAIKASLVSPIEAIRSNQEIKIRTKDIKMPKFIKKYFGIGGVIAYKNLKRSKKKYRTTIISLVVSITIFIGLSSFVQYSMQLVKNRYNIGEANVIVDVRGDISSEEQHAFYQQIAKLDNIDNYIIYGCTFYELLSKEAWTPMGEEFENLIQVCSIDDQSYQKYTQKLHINNADLSKTLIFIPGQGAKVDDEYYPLIKDDIQKITLDIDTNLDINSNKNTFNVYNAHEEVPFAYDSVSGNMGVFLTNELFNNIETNYYNMLILSSDAYQLTKDIRALNIDKIDIVNLKEEFDMTNRIILWVSVFLYGFIIVIALIGVTNIFNTITTNMFLRSKEFALLKSLGMSHSEFNRMIRFESILYGLKSLIIGTSFGLILSYLIYQIIYNGETIRGYIIPYPAMIIATIFIALVVGITMSYALKKINSQNIIETIRQDNI